ncbi:MAG: hypothetical protein RL375_4698 [Pseudomonadota bacterium]
MSKAAPLRDPSLASIKNGFDAATWQRGQRYAADGRVTVGEVADDEHAAIGWLVSAEVQGTELYETWLDLGCDEQGRWWFAGGCSCPVEHRCKHLAALVQVMANDYPEIVPQRALWAGLGGGPAAGPAFDPLASPAGRLGSGRASASRTAATMSNPAAGPVPPGAQAGAPERALDRWFEALEASPTGGYMAVPPVADNEVLYFALSELPATGRRSARLALQPMRATRLRNKPGELGKLRELGSGVRQTAAYSSDALFRDVVLAMDATAAILRSEQAGCIDGLVGLALLERAVQSGRTVVATADGSPGEPWHWGAPRRLGWRWMTDDSAATTGSADSPATWRLVPLLMPVGAPADAGSAALARALPARDASTDGSSGEAPASSDAFAGALRIDPNCSAVGAIPTTPPSRKASASLDLGSGTVARVLFGDSPTYTLPGERVVGPLQLDDLSPARAERLLAAPALPDAWLRQRANEARTRRLLPALPAGMAQPVTRRIAGQAPQIVIKLSFHAQSAEPGLLVSFDYDGVRGYWEASDSEQQFVASGAGLIDLHRDLEAEAGLLVKLHRHAVPQHLAGQRSGAQGKAGSAALTHAAAATSLQPLARFADGAADSSLPVEHDDGLTRPGDLVDLAPARATPAGTVDPAHPPGSLQSHQAWQIAAPDATARRKTFSRWLADDFAELRADGFIIEFERGWGDRIRQVDEVQVQLGDPGQGGPDDLSRVNDGGWLGLTMGFQLDGRRFNLLPWLPQLVAQMDQHGGAADVYTVEAVGQRSRLWLHDEAGQWWGLPAAMLKPWLTALVELVGERKSGDFQTTTLKLTRIDALRLAADTGQAGAPGGIAALRDVITARDVAGDQLPEPPPHLNATLRPYQLQGLAWLQALARQHLGGVLADDMGLGKTLQTLAHLLVEKQRGALINPALIVAPTSLVGNWRRECERFTPDLRLLVLHGGERHMRFDDIVDHDIVLTTYPLLPRDGEVLVKQPWHAVVLDEAQTIKNARTQAAQVVQLLRAGHRICLSGTPMENHLGEVWSLFHFLLPGYLSSEARFRSLFRNPIERQRDGERLTLLRRRLAPFMLRRSKDMVAAELPPKVETVVRVQMDPPQANLYETIRISTEASVRLALAEKGLARSHITVLDALLKLRQVCCDPQLLHLEQARRVTASAKLDWLMETLPEMIEEGRKVLLFSQFTSMLARIEERLAGTGLTWTKLTGQSKQRDELVEQFTSGKVPLFLISLKAGGVGLNLPQADTVIHYDPWWNPAVENQATDRAHRIGQNQTVFVYKLVAEGTLEERILALQERKAELARGLHGTSAMGAAAAASATGEPISASELDWLLQPLGAGLDSPRR